MAKIKQKGGRSRGATLERQTCMRQYNGGAKLCI
jgi:hypothetical protein